MSSEEVLKEENPENGIAEIVPPPLSEERIVSYERAVVSSVEEFFACIENGHSVEEVFFDKKKKYRKAIRLTKKRAKESADFYFLLVRLYLQEGKRYRQNKVWKLLKKCKYKEDPRYHFDLGEVYRYGLGARKDLKKAFSFYERAAEEKLCHGYIALSECYLKGLGTDKNETLCYQNIALAAQEHHLHARLLKARYEMMGFGCQKNIEEAASEFQKLYKSGYADAGCDYALCLLFGDGVPSDPKQGAKILKEETEKGNFRCKMGLGVAYLFGLGVGHNYIRAKKYFIETVDHEDYDGCYYLGVLKFNGWHCRKSYEDAFDLFTFGAENGSILCAKVLEDRYRIPKHGKGKVRKECKERIFH